MEPWKWVVTVSGGIAAMGGAATYIAKALRPARDLIQRVDSHARQLDNDNRRLRILEDGARATNLALLALLERAESGDNEAGVAEAKKALQKYLIER